MHPNVKRVAAPRCALRAARGTAALEGTTLRANTCCVPNVLSADRNPNPTEYSADLVKQDYIALIDRSAVPVTTHAQK